MWFGYNCHGMRLFMWFGYNLGYFLSLFHIVNLVIFSPFIYKQLVPLVSADPLTVLY